MADEETKEDDVIEENPKGGSKKLLIVGVLLGLLIGGGAAAGYFIMMPSDAVDEEVVAEVEPEPEPVLPDYQYAAIERLQLPNIYQGRILNYVMMNISMEVIGEKDKLLVEKNVLIIRDALIRYYSENPLGREDNRAIADFTSLSQKIKELANQEAHKEVVQRVIISQSRAI
ncbi:MAG: hypothetical protein HOH19_12470 [Kordiimonadaceae bacterium]|jgi:flagellar protein FliL|nr:hypothetical protein [Kordiimonadaceae bacterium]MBT6033381.1 hypothetical protein [Kordiimonadaceae bacterium]